MGTSSNSVYDEEQLLGFLRTGDSAAFAELYHRYRNEVYGYGLTLVKVPEIAEDLVQDVFVKIWDVHHKLEIKQNFRSYLFRVCHNRAIDINKEIARKRHLLDQLIYHYQFLPEADPISAEELQRYDELVVEALDSLTPVRRMVYDLCKVEKKSYEEAARELGISPNTVKAHMSKILSLLRDYFRQHGKITIVLLLLEDFYKK